MAKKGLLARKVAGAVNANQQFKEVESETQQPKEKASFKNQKATIKVSDDIKRDLDVIKSIHKIKFDYEAIQFLIDSYSNSLSPEDQRRFTVLRENL